MLEKGTYAISIAWTSLNDDPQNLYLLLAFEDKAQWGKQATHN
jgi:hypothetical protein